MSADGKVAQLAPDLMLKQKSIREYTDIIKERDVSYLRRGLAQPGGKLPLFDLDGQAFEAAVIRRCIARGWAEPWFNNPLKPDWLVCKLTAAGRIAVENILDRKSASSRKAAS